MRRFWALLVMCGVASSAAEKPVLEQVFPAGLVRGRTNEIRLFGKVEPWPPGAWSSIPGVEFQFSTNKGQAQVVVSPEAPAGPGLVRLFNEQGPSDLQIVVVTESAENTETEPNDHFAHPQIVEAVPTVINGRLEKSGDVDSYRIQVKTGQWLDAALDCYTLMAKLDPVLRLVTTNGFQLAWNHDFGSLDPRLIWQAPYDSTVVLQVFGFAYPANAEIRLSGGANGVYRLHLGVADAAPSDLSEVSTESEPNDTPKEAPAVQLPARIVGTISPTGDIDRFQVTLTKGETIEARVEAASIGSTLDAWATVESAEGKELARSDDADNSRDPRLEWKAPEDGKYVVGVGSLLHRGGADQRYHLRISALPPDYEVRTSADAFSFTAGTTNAIKLNLKRLRGFTNELAAALEGLPPGVSSERIAIPASKQGEVEMSLIVASNAIPTNCSFSVMVSDPATHTTHPALFDLVSRTENNGVPGGYSKLLVESTDKLWLTVRPPEEAKGGKK